MGRIISEIERGFQQMIQETSLSTNHLKTLAKTLKWENSALKQYELIEIFVACMGLMMSIN